MNPFVYRQKLINIAKNLKNSGAFFDSEIICLVEKIINYCYNLQFKHSQHLRRKLDIIIAKYKLSVVEYNQQKIIVFTKINKQFDLTILYKQLADFLCKIQFFINLSNSDIKQLQQLFLMLDNPILNNVVVVPMINHNNQLITNYNQVISKYCQQQKIIYDLIKNNCQSEQISNIKNTDNVIHMNFLMNSKDPISQSDVKTLID